MKRYMEEHPTSDPRDVFDMFCGVESEFPGVERNLQKIKNKINPPIPKQKEEIVECLSSSQYSPLLQDVAYYNEHLALIWYPNELSDILQQIHVPEVCMDATFRCVPDVFGPNGQHFTIMGLFNRVGTEQDNWLPMVHVSMTCKQEGLYTAVLDKVWSELTSLRPAYCHCDFERQLHNAIETVTDTQVIGCWFHHNDAVKRKVSQEGLLGECQKNRLLTAWTRSFFPLPLLPPNKIEDGWRWVRLEMGPVLESLSHARFKPAVSEVLDYWMRVWMIQIGTDKVSCWGKKYRTNNAVESLNARLNKGIRGCAKFWAYPEKIQRMSKRFVEDVQRLQKGLRVTRPRKKTQVQTLIEKYSRDFEEDGDVGRFIKRARYLGCKSEKVVYEDPEDYQDPGPAPALPAPVATATADLATPPPQAAATDPATPPPQAAAAAPATPPPQAAAAALATQPLTGPARRTRAQAARRLLEPSPEREAATQPNPTRYDN